MNKKDAVQVLATLSWHGMYAAEVVAFNCEGKFTTEVLTRGPNKGGMAYHYSETPVEMAARYAEMFNNGGNDLVEAVKNIVGANEVRYFIKG